MDYRPFLSCVASLFLLPAMAQSEAAAFTQSASPVGGSTSAQKKFSSSPEASSTVIGSSESSVGNPQTSPASSATPLLAGATKIDGLIPLYRQQSKLYAALRPQDLDTDFIFLISIARGIAQRPLVGGHTWQFGNDWICQFRRVEDRIQFVRRNVRYRANEGSPESLAVRLAYSDSILFSLPILASRPDKSLIVDLTPVFMCDLPGISQELEEFEFAADKSNWSSVCGYEKNLEIQVAATYTSDGGTILETVPDSRSLTAHIHYSLSKVPQSNYRPRLADDRIGYFLTVRKDFSRSGDEDRFVRYINRWRLEKADPTLAVSPPKKPIVFWLEKTIPHHYRQPIREGILQWNKAFEKIGFRNAIQVRQQPDDATWEPGDVRYNTFRWITSGMGVAAGPSRVNPLTGEILDADITFDADFLQMWKRKYECFTPETIARMTGGPLDLESYRRQQSTRSTRREHYQYGCNGCDLEHSFSHDLALSAAVMARRRYSPEELEKMTIQAVKKVAMHEVGHTLGLRHNFKASTLYTIAELQTLSLQEGDVSLCASVMDYLPANLAAPGEPQGLYYSSTIGPYDYWAIEYGYSPLPDCATSAEELPQLGKIAARSGAFGHAFATDEDTRGIDADPHSGMFDYGSDLLEFAEAQADIVAQSWPELVERVTQKGGGYQQARQAFGVLLTTHGRAMFAVSRYIGGLYTSRSHRGDAGARLPQVVVEAEQQRRALELLSLRMFSDEAFDFSPQLFQGLAITHWKHWGSERPERTDFPVHESVLLWQDRILEKLLSPLTLARLHDSERQVPLDQDAFTVAELLACLTSTIFAEVATLEERVYTNRQPAISSMRRMLQHAYLERVTELAEGASNAPSDCQAIALLELTRLRRQIEDRLQGKAKLDSYSMAHLTATASRIARVLDVQYASGR
ncbi:MAG: zinc-dependent metalloprotease [Pirellulales bacterium]|nr:zinc-dependent metalloprotease [Pirellulales bacterium]